MDSKERVPQTSVVLGAAFEVHKLLGYGFLENVYRKALCEELRLRSTPYKQEVHLPVFYKGVELNCNYRADLIVYEKLLVECKSQAGLTPYDDAQVLHYLHSTALEKALLINFGRERLQFKRFILTEEYRRRGQGVSHELG